MSPTLTESLRWTTAGTALIDGLLADLGEADYTGPCLLPGWSRRHLVAHAANNAVALANLVHWAATGQVTPMYASLEQREADIQRDAALSGAVLTRRFAETAESLAWAMAALSADQWDAEVLTVRDERLRASAVPWLRAREVMIHAVDLDLGVDIDDLPPEFLSALCADICRRRTSLAQDPPMILRSLDGSAEWSIGSGAGGATLTGSLAAIAAYLSGRGREGISAESGAVPTLGGWL